LISWWWTRNVSETCRELTGNKVLWRDICWIFLDKLIHDARNIEHKIYTSCVYDCLLLLCILWSNTQRGCHNSKTVNIYPVFIQHDKSSFGQSGWKECTAERSIQTYQQSTKLNEYVTVVHVRSQLDFYYESLCFKIGTSQYVLVNFLPKI
jgi:hypothetical protein